MSADPIILSRLAAQILSADPATRMRAKVSTLMTRPHEFR